MIVNLDGPSVPQELYATVPHIAIPYVPIIEQGRKPYSMLSDLRKFTWFVWPPVEFMDIADLIELAKARIVESAEKRANEIFKNVVEG